MSESGAGDPGFGSPHHRHRRTDSTNLRARELAEAGAPSGTVVTAEEQSSGRGRAGRVWSAPAGEALLYSAILRPLDLSHLMRPLAVPLAVCEACEAVAPVRCMLKWPNDIWLDERKLAGVLIEARGSDWAVIGVGVNLSIAPESFPADLRWPATSLGHGVSPETMRPALDAALSRWVAAAPDLVQAEFSRRDVLQDREIHWEGGPSGDGRSGVGAGIDERGNLLVRGAGGELSALGSGEVSLRVG
ncbi:MAG: biotin--[acetyl-CoA-carboxylase] ligase [Solirubrobacterales bacterium]